MKFLVFHFIFVTCFTIGLCNVPEGKFETSGGSHCEWKEEDYSPDSKAMALKCDCLDNDNKIISYSCEYEGNPSGCDLLRKEGFLARFYGFLADHFKGTK